MIKTEKILPRVKLGEPLIGRIKKVLGDDNGGRFERLWAEYHHLRVCFNDLKNGFGGADPPMLQVWAVEPKFDGRYRNLLVGEIVAAASRLTDNTKNAVSINKVLPRLFRNQPDHLKTEMDRLVRAATDATRPLREWRNKQMAHTATETERTSVSGDETENAIGAIGEALLFVWHQRLNVDNCNYTLAPLSVATADLGEHLSIMHERTIAFETWLLRAAGHHAADDIPGAVAAVRRLAGRREPEATPRDESDPVVEFLKGAEKARAIASKIADMRSKHGSSPAARPAEPSRWSRSKS